MDKKVLNGLVEAMVEQVKSDNGISESEARALIGMTLRRLAPKVVEACKVPDVVIG